MQFNSVMMMMMMMTTTTTTTMMMMMVVVLVVLAVVVVVVRRLNMVFVVNVRCDFADSILLLCYGPPCEKLSIYLMIVIDYHHLGLG